MCYHMPGWSALGATGYFETAASAEEGRLNALRAIDLGPLGLPLRSRTSSIFVALAATGESLCLFEDDEQ